MNNTYKIDWLEKATTSTGKAYAKITLEGHADKKISIWSDFPNFANLMPGQEIVGELKQNDKGYWNVYPPRAENSPKTGGNRMGMMKEVMAEKSQPIRQSQANKELGIKVASTMNSAVQIALAMIKDDKTVIWTDGLVKDEIRKWREFLWLEWDKEEKDFPPFNG